MAGMVGMAKVIGNGEAAEIGEKHGKHTGVGWRVETYSALSEGANGITCASVASPKADASQQRQAANAGDAKSA